MSAGVGHFPQALSTCLEASFKGFYMPQGRSCRSFYLISISIITYLGGYNINTGDVFNNKQCPCFSCSGHRGLNGMECYSR